MLFLVLGSLFPLMASGPCLDSSSVRTSLRHYSTPSLHSPFLLAHFIASHPPAWKAVMCLFYLFSPGKVNFVHWCVLGLTCTQKTVVILRIHYVKEASVDKDGSQLMKGSPPRKSAFQEHGVGVGWGRLKLLRGSPLFAADIINRKVLLWNVGLSTPCPSHQLEAWKCDLIHQNPISASTKWELRFLFGFDCRI